jgi:hypothetical protein
MSNENLRRCLVMTERGEIKGTIVNEYEEIGGPDDGAIFAVIDLDNGQILTVKMSEVFEQ